MGRVLPVVLFAFTCFLRWLDICRFCGGGRIEWDIIGKTMSVPDTSNDREASMPEIEQREELLELTARIVTAHVSKNEMAVADLPGLIGTVHETLAAVGEGPAAKGERLFPSRGP